jgi:hypothetical protein
LSTASKLRELWYLQINNKATPFLYNLKVMSIQQMKDQIHISRHEWDSHLLEWEYFVGTDYSFQIIEEPIRKLEAVREVLQTISKLLFPLWIMDRFKEALDQHVRGEWLSSISLCGDIVEFIANEFWTAYRDKIPREHVKTPSDSTKTNLKRLLEFGVLDECDYNRLFFVRDTRDNHVHEYLRRRLSGDYADRLKSDNAEVIRRLSEFFAIDNMEKKYSQYLKYAETLLSYPGSTPS